MSCLFTSRTCQNDVSIIWTPCPFFCLSCIGWRVGFLFISLKRGGLGRKIRWRHGKKVSVYERGRGRVILLGQCIQQWTKWNLWKTAFKKFEIIWSVESLSNVSFVFEHITYFDNAKPLHFISATEERDR